MNRRVKIGLIFLWLLAAIGTFSSCVTHVHAAELKEVYVTGYTATGNPCANGQYPVEGIVAYAPEYIDTHVLILYESIDGIPGDMIDVYEIWDTGNPAIQEGQVVDIYHDTEEACYAFAAEYGTKGFIEVITKEEYDERQRFNSEAETEDSGCGCLRNGEISSDRIYTVKEKRFWSLGQLYPIRR